MSQRFSWNWALAALIAASAAALYLRTLQPSLGGMYNSEEYQYAAYSLSLAHSTGYPLYLILGKIFLTLVPLGDVAYRMNLFSAVWAVSAAVLAYCITLQLGAHRAASVLSALLFAANEAVWRYASVAEVDTLTAFLAGGVFLMLLLWRQSKVRLEWVALLYGFALAHHRTSILYAPGIVLFVVLTQPQALRSPALIARTLLLGLVPLLVYIYVPLRAATEPTYAATPSLLWGYIVGNTTTSNAEFIAPPGEWLARAGQIYYAWLWNWFTPVGVALALVGYVGWWKSRLPEVNAALRLLFGLTFVILTLFTLPSRAADIDRYLIVPVLILAICAGVGVTRVAQWIENSARARHPRAARAANVLLLIALFGLPLRAVMINFPNVDFSPNDKVYALWDEIFNLPLERGALIIGNWSEINALKYMQRVEGRRVDLQSVPTFSSRDAVTAAVEKSLALGKPVYLTPGDPAPTAALHYSALGPLVRVFAKPNLDAPAPPVAQTQTLGEVTLIGYGLSGDSTRGVLRDTVQVAPDDSARLTLYFRADKKPRADYQLRVRLVDSANHAVWQNIAAPLRELYPMTQWSAGAYVTDAHNIYVPPGTPPGAYQIQLALVNVQTQQLVEAPALLKTVNVPRARAPLADKVFVRQRLNMDFGSLRLLGFSAGSADVKPGATLGFALAWHARAKLNQDYSLRVRLVDGSGRIWHESTLPLVHDYPTSQWQPDDAFKEYYTLSLPSAAPTATAYWRVAVLDDAGRTVKPATAAGEDVQLSSFTVSP